MKAFYKKLEIPIYGRCIHICHYSNTETANKILNKKGIPVAFEKSDLDAGAIVTYDFSNLDLNAVMLFAEEGITHEAIAHEAEHISGALLKYIGMKKTAASEEAYCYLTGWIVQQVTLIIKSKGIKIKD